MTYIRRDHPVARAGDAVECVVGVPPPHIINTFAGETPIVALPPAPPSPLPPGLTITTPSDHEVEFSILGGDSITRSGYLPVKAPGIITGIPYRVFDITDRQFGAVAGPMLGGGPDVTDAIQDALNSAQSHGEGAVLIPKPDNGGSFWFTNLGIDYATIVHGVHRRLCRLRQLPSASGPALTINHPPGARDGDSAKAALRSFYLGCSKAGVVYAYGNTAAGSKVITGVTGGVGAQPGWIVEAVGTPAFSLLESIGGGVINMSKATTESNSPAGANPSYWRTKIQLREAVTRSGTTTAGSDVVVMADTNGVKSGMLVRATGLVTEGAARVKSIQAGGITLDRKAIGSGTADLLCYVSNDGIYVPDASLAPGYDSSLVYSGADIDSVFVEGFSGFGLNVRPGRSQVRVTDGKILDCCVGGAFFNSVNDCFAKGFNSGRHWGPALKVTACATMRVIGGEVFTTYDTIGQYELDVRNCNEFQAAFVDLNGRMRAYADATEGNDTVNLIGVNFKFFGSNTRPDGTQRAYVEAFAGANISVRDGCFVPELDAPHERPDYIAYADGARALVTVDQDGWPSDPGEWRRPYAVNISQTANGGHIDMRYIDKTTWERKTHSVGIT